LNSNFNTIAESNITDEYTELRLIDSNYNIILKNKIAFLTLAGEGNIVAKNNITKELNNGGLKNNITANRINQLNLGSNSTYHANDISKMTIAGADNLFYGNNFQGYDLRTTASGAQLWDNGSLGNYWSDYLTKYPNASEIGNLGVGDTPYVIDGDNVDNYPLMSPFDIDSVTIELPDWASPPSVHLINPENMTYTSANVALEFTINKQTIWMGYSLDGQKTVTINGNTTLEGLANGLHNVTIYAEDTFGNVGASETVSFTVEVPFPVAPVTATSVAIVAVVGVGLLVYLKKRKH
jgi:hypothetical protein